MSRQENRKMTKVTTKDLTGIALDWAVATCEGYILTTDGISHLVEKEGRLSLLGPATSAGKPCGYSPSSYWAQGGLIIEREGIDIHQVKHHPFHTYAYSETTKARFPDGEVSATPGGTRFIKVPRTPGVNDGKWTARMSVDHHPFGWKKDDFMSDTALSAAMRCYVAKKLGDYLDVPSELVGDVGTK
jgi:hypothetical protein